MGSWILRSFRPLAPSNDSLTHPCARYCRWYCFCCYCLLAASPPRPPSPLHIAGGRGGRDRARRTLHRPSGRRGHHPGHQPGMLVHVHSTCRQRRRVLLLILSRVGTAAIYLNVEAYVSATAANGSRGGRARRAGVGLPCVILARTQMDARRHVRGGYASLRTPAMTPPPRPHARREKMLRKV